MPIEYDPERSDYSLGHEVFVQTETGDYMHGRLVDRESRFFSYAVFNKCGVGIVGFEGKLHAAKFCKDDPDSVVLLQFIVLEAWDIARSIPYTKNRFKITDIDPLFDYITRFLHGRRAWMSRGIERPCEFEVIFDRKGNKIR